MKNIKKILLSFFAIVILLGLSGCGCKQLNNNQFAVKLEIWGLFENEDPYRDIFQEYEKANPNISITYKKMAVDSYQKDLLDALASGQGPDIFLIHNNWVPSFGDKIYPAPSDIINEQKVRNDFVDVVADDFVFGGKIFALPLSVDSLGLYYNKDLFNEAGITSPPKTWDEFVADARRLTKFDEQSQIIQSGAAMGTSANINRSTDILGLLMLQNGTMMIDDEFRQASFDRYFVKGDENFSPGENALNFYTQFANRNSQSIPYVWNQRMHYSIDAFSEGTLGMMFNYSWQMDVVESKAPKLNYAVASIPQFPNTKQVNYANYWGYTVAKNKTPSQAEVDANKGVVASGDVRAGEAWKLLTYMTTKHDAVSSASATAVVNQVGIVDPAANYLDKTRKPAARRDLVEKQKTDVRLGVFAQGNLIAKNWYQIAPDSIEALFAQMITQINNGEVSVSSALKSAALAVSQMMSR